MVCFFVMRDKLNKEFAKLYRFFVLTLSALIETKIVFLIWPLWPCVFSYSTFWKSVMKVPLCLPNKPKKTSAILQIVQRKIMKVISRNFCHVLWKINHETLISVSYVNSCRHLNCKSSLLLFTKTCVNKIVANSSPSCLSALGENLIACENKRMNIVCEEGQTVNIIAADYGRTVSCFLDLFSEVFVHSGIFPQFGNFSEFRDSDKSLKHELGSIQSFWPPKP